MNRLVLVAVRLVSLLTVAAVLVAAAGAAVATDGSLITTGGTGNRIWLVVSKLDGSQTHPLASPPPNTARRSEDYGASWSPDGTTAAFIRKVNASTSIRVVDVNGRQPVLTVSAAQIRRLVGDGALVGGASMWSRSGSHVLFSVLGDPGSGCRTTAIVRAATDGSSLETVWRLAPTGSAIAWPNDVAPDGLRTLITVTPNDGDCRFGHESDSSLRIVSANGAQRRIPKVDVPGLWFIPEASWSPDGSMIVFSGGCAPICQLYRVSGTGTGRMQLTHYTVPELPEFHDFDTLSWLWLDNGRLLVARKRLLQLIDPAHATTRTLLRLPCPPTRPKCNASTTTLYAASEDGNRVALQTYDLGGKQIITRSYVVAIDTGELEQLPRSPREWADVHLPQP